MSERDNATVPPECGGDAAAYVLGALGPAEAEAFRLHLDTCIVCRDEVAAFERVVDVLPSAAPQYRAPRSLRRRVLKEVSSEAKQSATQAKQLAKDSRGGRRWPGRGAVAIPRPLLAGAGALAVAAVVLGLALGSGGGGTRVISASVSGRGTAKLRVSGGRGELIVRGFAPAPAGKVYEVWLQRGKRQPTPTRTLFSVTSTGAADVGVADRLGGVSVVMVTPEPDGGSQVPTHAPVIVARIT